MGLIGLGAVDVDGPQYRIIGFDRGSDDYAAIAEVSFGPPGVMTIEKVTTLRDVVDLPPGEYKDLSDGRSAGDPSGGE